MARSRASMGAPSAPGTPFAGGLGADEGEGAPGR